MNIIVTMLSLTVLISIIDTLFNVQKEYKLNLGEKKEMDSEDCLNKEENNDGD